MTNKKSSRKKMSLMTKASFFFASMLMLFIGVIGAGILNVSYAFPTGVDIPNKLNMRLIETPDWELEYITGVKLLSNLVTDINGTTYSVYCLEKEKDFPNGEEYNKDDNLSSTMTADKGIVYIVSNAYNNPNSFLAGFNTEQERKYIVQYAIWYYQNLVNPTKGVTSAEKAAIDADGHYGAKIKSIADQALIEKNKPDTVDSLSIAKENITYNISSDGKYFETSYINVISSNDKLKKYAVAFTTTTEGAEIVNEQGVAVPTGTELSPTERFKVRVPLDKLKDVQNIVLGLKVTANFEHNQVFAFSPTDTSFQTVLLADVKKVLIPTNLDLNLTVPTGPVQISKVDITNEKELPGATLTIKDCTGKELAKWVSTDKPYYIEALPVSTEQCKYTLTETIAPEGYELNTNSVTFEVKADGKVNSVKMTNTPLTPTPNTGTDIPIIVYITGFIILICGVAIVYASVKPAKQK